MNGSCSPKVIVSATRPARYRTMAFQTGVYNWRALKFKGIIAIAVRSTYLAHCRRACECVSWAKGGCLEKKLGEGMTTAIWVLLAKTEPITMTGSLSLLTNTTRQNIAIVIRPALCLILNNAICVDRRATSIRQMSALRHTAP